MKMALEISLLIAVIILLICLFFYFAPISLSPSFFSGKVCIAENCFNVEVASTAIQRERGLMFRKNLAKNEGMLFVFNKEAIYPFWMKNTLIPLDIIWIKDNKIVSISENNQPCKDLICDQILPSAIADHALEINAGSCERLGIELGQNVEIILNR